MPCAWAAMPQAREDGTKAIQIGIAAFIATVWWLVTAELLPWAIGVLAATAWFTVLQRILHVRKELRAA